MENLGSSVNLNSPLYPPGINRRGYSTSIASGLGQSLGPPAKANPLTDVIGQAGPQGLQRYLNQPTHPKLAQPNFVLNPRVRKLRHPSPLLIDGLRFRRLHLRLESDDFWRCFAPYHRSPSLRPRAALGLKLTCPTVRGLGSVTVSQHSSLSLLGFISQYLACRTSITVGVPIILKGLWVKVRTHSKLLQPMGCHSASLRQRPNQIDLLLGHRLHRCLIGKAAIHYDMLRLLAQVGLHSIDRRFQFRRIRRGLSHPHPDNDLGLRIGRNLNVISRPISAVALQHDSGFRVRTAGPSLLLLRCLGPRGFDLLHCLQSFFQALLLFLQRSLPRLRYLLAQFFRFRISH